MKEIKLTSGDKCLVDDADFAFLNQFTWGLSVPHNIAYASTNMKVDGKVKSIRMHNLIMLPPKGMHTDHIDGNGLNNIRANLRVCLPIQNTRNRKMCSRNKSGMRGVSWYKRDQKWHAQIMVNRKQIHLGYFDNIFDAAKEYNLAAIKYFGEYSRLNVL